MSEEVIPEETPVEDKFNTCRFRSAKLVPLTKRVSCCKTQHVDGYVCFELQFEDVKPEICTVCKKYQKKKDAKSDEATE